MADDKPGGDDLFEDLDKFFAPIRDVDWESEESTPAADTPQEEHVAVRPSESEPIVIADEPDTAVSALRRSMTKTTRTPGTTPACSSRSTS